MFLRWPAPRVVVTIAAISAVVPLLAPAAWTGFRLAQSDPVLAVISASEQPLSVRRPEGVWAITVTLVWWSLAYWQRRIAPWEILLVLVGAASVLTRLGNAWVYALALACPLAKQLRILDRRPLVLASLALASLTVGLLTVSASAPPALPAAAEQAVAASPARGHILADWRWAGALQQRLGGDRDVLAAGGMLSESKDFWVDYVRIARGHERWAGALQRLDVDLVVLESSDQQREAATLVRASTDWLVLYDADGALVAERIGP